MKQKILAAKVAIAIAFTAGAIATAPVQAGIPVIDGANLTQNVLNTIETIAQTLKQIEEYKTQLEQYEDQLKNTMAPSMYIWDQAQQTINKLMAATDTLNYYKNQLGSVDGYLSKFQDVNYYRSSPCFNSTSNCSASEMAALEENRRLASESQKKANDALFKGLDEQQNALKKDAYTLERLQAAASSAEGRMEALGYANQLASQQANQLLQIRGLMVAQQNAIATRMQAEANLEAQHQAAAESLRKSKYQKSPSQDW